MDRFQKQAIILSITSIETQLQGLRQLVGMTGASSAPESLVAQPGNKGPENYTSEEEDLEIEQALEFPDSQKDSLLQNIFQRAREPGELND